MMGLYAKLANVMANISGVEKSGKNAFFNYRFTTADAAYEAVRTAMANEGLAFVASMVDVQQHETGQTDKGGNAVVRTVAKFEYTFIDPETGESKTCLWHGEATDSQDKGVSKASTSALKYFLLKTFIISTEADDPDRSDGYQAKKPSSRPTPEQIRNAGNALESEQSEQGNASDEPPATRATLSPDKLVTTLKSKATSVNVPVTKDEHGVIEPILLDDAKTLAKDMETVMDKATRQWILVQAFSTDTCKDLNPREAAAIQAWLKDKPAAHKDADGVKALLDKQAQEKAEA